MTTAEQLRHALPEPVAERVRHLSDGAAVGGFVLAWLRTAQRAHDNPALDAALLAADALDVPVFVYHALSERYPHASDRHHRFILEGARDLQAQLRDRGLGTAFHLERPGHRGPHLRTLAERAALVVTEDLPVPPLTTWTTRLRDTCSTPVWAVDTACIVPMRLSPSGVERAYAFRQRFAETRAARVRCGWIDQPVRRPGFVPDDLPFAPVELGEADLPELIAACEIDHTVGPVTDTPGGTRAGYERWAHFRDHKLPRYARDRNSPTRDGVSRMSAYLHYGMVSPFRLAADAQTRGGAGAAKWLDELLIWREAAHAWCGAQRDLHRLDVLPQWAQETLAHHAADPRPALPSWETLVRGRTGDALWDACQQSLLRHGELHNNLRMTWGKQLLRWTRDPEHARTVLVELNHRYALDGRDPSSYGGLYWCLGLMDRPFHPERPITGTVRARDTAEHAQRVPLGRYSAHVRRPLRDPPPRVAVVGAGISGLTCARVLRDHGVPVTLFDKSRGPSGRMSTRRADGGLQFDHGAQFFTARDPAFARHVDSWVHDGHAAVWQGRFGRLGEDGFRPEPPPRPRYVGTPRMSALGRHLAAEVPVSLGVRIAAVERRGRTWCLRDADGGTHGDFDRIVLAVPAAQAVPLLQVAPTLAASVATAEMVPCLALMLQFDQPPELPWDGVRVDGGPLAWIAHDSSKPGRASPGCFVAHTRPSAARALLERPVEDSAGELTRAFQAVTGVRHAPSHAVAHRWRYARPALTRVSGPRCRYDRDLGLGVCGDWLVGARVEGAWLSGAAMAGRLLGTL